MIWFPIKENTWGICITHKQYSLLDILFNIYFKLFSWWYKILLPIFSCVFSEVWFHATWNMEHKHVIFSVIITIHIEYCYGIHQSFILSLELIMRIMVIFARVSLGISLLLLWDESSPHIFCNIVFMLWQVLMNFEGLDSEPSSSTLEKATFLASLLYVVTRNLSVSRGVLLILYGNPNR